MKMRFAHISELVIVSGTGHISILNSYDAMTIAGLPAVIPKMYVAVGITAERQGEGGSHSVKLEFRDPESRPIWVMEGNFSLPESVGILPGFNLNFVQQAVNISTWGLHELLISLDGAHTMTLDLNVMKGVQTDGG